MDDLIFELTYTELYHEIIIEIDNFIDYMFSLFFLENITI